MNFVQTNKDVVFVLGNWDNDLFGTNGTNVNLKLVMFLCYYFNKELLKINTSLFLHLGSILFALNTDALV